MMRLLTMMGLGFFLASGSSRCLAGDWEWHLVETGVSTGLRGMSVSQDGAIWVGAKGQVLRSDDHGATWKTFPVADFSELEFRSIHAFDSKRACIASAGSPAVILMSSDGGEHWREAFRHPSKLAFFDSLFFLNPQRGIAISDPIDGKWLILETEDGGQTWQSSKQAPVALEKEAAFAASNSSFHALTVSSASETWWLGTGGAVASSTDSRDNLTPKNILRYSASSGWERFASTLASGESSGVFAIHVREDGMGIAVGGDYRQESARESTAAWTMDGGATWRPAEKLPSGFRSAVVPVTIDSKQAWIAIGPNGMDFSTDGKNWNRVSETGFHSVRTSPDGYLYGIGSKGRFGRLKLP